jgi:hypothetical protein
MGERGHLVEPEQAGGTLDGVDQPKGLVEARGVRGLGLQPEERLHERVEILVRLVEIQPKVFRHFISGQTVSERG